MLTEIFMPKPELAHIVRCYFTLGTPDDANCCQKKFRFLPDGCPELIFHFGIAPLKQLGGKEGSSKASAALMGLYQRHVDVQLCGPSQTLFVQFQPWVQGWLLGDAARIATDHQLEIEDVFRHGERNFMDSILAAVDPKAAIAMIEEWLLNRLKTFALDRQVVHAVGLLRQSRGKIPIQTLEEGVNLGIRRLEQKFADQVGVSLKYFARIVRIRNTAEAIRISQATRLADVGYDHGFFDQAHLIHEFKHFVNMTPTTFARAIRGKSTVYELEVVSVDV